MAYAANHDFPELNPGLADWSLSSYYAASGLAIFTMGILIGTVPAGRPHDGTNASGAMQGYYSWLAGEPELTATCHWAKNNYAPLLDNMAQLSKPTSVDVDTTGRQFVADQGQVHEFTLGASGYVAAPGSNWLGKLTGDRLRISKSRANDDATISRPG